MIYEHLAIGRNNAKTGKQLAAELGIDIRAVTAQIERERRAGQPICATMRSDEKQGYFLAANREELDIYCKMLKSRAVALFTTRQALVRVLAQLPALKMEEQKNNGKDN